MCGLLSNLRLSVAEKKLENEREKNELHFFLLLMFTLM